jgi:serine/threonine protein phosphatase PrpC
MAAALTAAWIVPPLVYVAEIGDLRCYLIRDGVIKQITRESVVVPGGAEIAVRGTRSLSASLLGLQPRVTPVVSSIELARGDLLLLCSSSLGKMLGEIDLLERVATLTDCESVTSILFEIANRSSNNAIITAVAAVVDGEAFSPPEALSGLFLSEAADESELSDELLDLTDSLSPVSGDE